MKTANKHLQTHQESAFPVADMICYLTGCSDTPHPLDLAMHHRISRLTGGLSPASLLLAWLDWHLHLSFSPGKQAELLRLLENQLYEWPLLLTQIAGNQGMLTDEQIKTSDTRFKSESWSNWPYNLISRQFLQAQSFWDSATTGVRGVSSHHENVVNFAARQWLDMIAPANFYPTNPEVQRKTFEEFGANLWRGLQNWGSDVRKGVAQQMHKSETNEDLPFRPGREVAISEGKVVFSNHLIELIQYAPATETVYSQPVLIVPSWIMKYYILDLSPHNSMVKFLTAQGFTVFIISWRNPDSLDRDLGMDDYVQSGFYAALKEVSKRCDGAPVHTAGYCLGGTLLAIGMAGLPSLEESGEITVASMTLLAAQTDFTEPGELGLFIDESQLAMLDALMWKQGYLDGQQMAGSFQLLNSKDLIWSRNMRRYLLGEAEKSNDLMSWNSDTTRMPYRMHSEYLNHLFLHNDLAQGRYQLNGRTVSLKAINIPLFVVGTEKDHVSPWRSVYKIHSLSDVTVDFILASGGHNAGIVAAPGNPKCSFYTSKTLMPGEAVPSPDEWLNAAQRTNGSWWLHWSSWLANQNSDRVPARQLAEKFATAPGTYIFQ